MSESAVRSLSGITGLRTWRELRGEACIEFEDGFEVRQSICVSRSFATEIYDVAELAEQVSNFAAAVAEKLRKQHSATSEMTIFAFTNRFKESTPQTYGTQLVHFTVATNDQRTIVTRAVAALRDLYKRGYGYKKAGVVATHIIPAEGVVHSLFDDSEAVVREHNLSAVVDAINRTHGRGAVRFAVQGSGHIKSASEKQSPHYTTRWSDIPLVSVK